MFFALYCRVARLLGVERGSPRRYAHRLFASCVKGALGPTKSRLAGIRTRGRIFSRNFVDFRGSKSAGENEREREREIDIHPREKRKIPLAPRSHEAASLSAAPVFARNSSQPPGDFLGKIISQRPRRRHCMLYRRMLLVNHSY